MILGTTFVIASLKSFIMLQFSKLNFGQFFGFVWTSFIAYFGGQPSGTTIDGKRSYKTILMVSLLGGLVIWIAFNASLTSKLAVDIKEMPFHDLESFSKTNWR